VDPDMEINSEPKSQPAEPSSNQSGVSKWTKVQWSYSESQLPVVKQEHPDPTRIPDHVTPGEFAIQSAETQQSMEITSEENTLKLKLEESLPNMTVADSGNMFRKRKVYLRGTRAKRNF